MIQIRFFLSATKKPVTCVALSQLLSVIILLFLTGCGPDKQKKTADTVTADTAKFYPVDNFIQEQIKYVDLRDFTIQKIHSVNKDSVKSVLTKNQFIIEAADVLALASSWNKNRHLYRESVFQDLSTASYTINYTATDPQIPLQRIDILLNEQTNIIKRLFIRQEFELNDTLVTRMYSWMADHGFSINTSKTATGFSNTETTAINWTKPAGK